MAMAEATLTINEVAVLAGTPRAAVDKAIEAKTVTVTLSSKRPTRKPLLRAHAPVLVAVAARMKGPLSRVYKARIRKAFDAGVYLVELQEGLSLDLEKIAGDVIRGTTRYLANRSVHIERRKDVLGGTPVIKGTRVTVYAIEARVDAGESRESLLEDFPQITAEQIETACVYAKTHPLRGRPAVRPAQ